jgi:hypothetical protein
MRTICPDALDFTSTRSTGSIVPDASTVRLMSRRVTASTGIWLTVVAFFAHPAATAATAIATPAQAARVPPPHRVHLIAAVSFPGSLRLRSFMDSST